MTIVVLGINVVPMGLLCVTIVGIVGRGLAALAGRLGSGSSSPGHHGKTTGGTDRVTPKSHGSTTKHGADGGPASIEMTDLGQVTVM
jgi:hypothetical protein